RLEPEPRAHRRIGRITDTAGLMAGGPQIASIGRVGGEANSVIDRARRDFVVGQEPGQNRQAGGIGGGPSGRSQRIAVEMPRRAAARPPFGAGRGRRAGEPSLVKPAGALVDDDRVSVARLPLPALNRDIEPERITDLIALRGIIEAY